jgi:malonate transporter
VRLLDAFVPIWVLTALGYLAQRYGLLGPGAATVLGRFVFHVAMPAALFLAMAATPLGELASGGVLAFAVSTAAAMAAGWWGVARLAGAKPGERPIWGMAAGYVNSANLGIPVAMQVLGTVSFLAVVLLVQVLVVTPVILLALDRHGDADGRVRLRRIASLPLRNPVMLASALGAVCSATGLTVPSVAAGPLRLLAAAAVPTALVALGASLHAEGDRPPARVPLAAVVALKLFAQPAVALATGLLLGLSRPALLALVVFAGLPTAQNTFIFAQEYRAAETLANRAVLISTTLSLGTLAGIAALLGGG